MLIVGLATGFDHVARRVIGFFLAVAIVIFVLIRVFGVQSTTPPPAQPGFGDQAPASPAEQIVTISIGGLLLLAAMVGIIILIALWMRRTPAPDGLIRAAKDSRHGGATGSASGPRRPPRSRPMSPS
jgi:hypothetical protein